MKIKTVRGMKMGAKSILPTPAQITIRAERTTSNGQTLTTLSLSDDSNGSMLMVDYDDIKEVINGLKKL